MTKKLKLSDFLSQEDSPIVSEESIQESGLTCPLDEFISAISSHGGSFLVDSKVYLEAISSDYSAYFFEGAMSPSLIMYESLIDIKKRDGKFVVFCDHTPAITITLVKGDS